MSEELSTPDQDPASKPQPEATADSAEAQADSVKTEGSDELKSKDSPEAASQAEGRTRFNIRIGSSRRPKADAETSESDAAEEIQDETPTLPQPEELDAALEAALSDDNIEELLKQTTGAVDELTLESKTRATVMRSDAENVFFSLGGPHEGITPLRQFETPPELGAELDVMITGRNPEDGLYELSLPGAAVEVGDWADIVEGAVVTVKITGTNTGGLECRISEAIRGFIPASQISLYRVENFNEYLEQKLLCVITKVGGKGRRSNVILSRRAILEREREQERKEKLAELEVGAIVDGVVRSIRDFGAFVDIGGMDGLLHVSQLSWERVNHPSDVVSEGQKIRVKIDKVNRETGKVGLSYKALSEHPWTNIGQKVSVQSSVTGPVTRIANFGAFVKIEAGVEGLIHISELAHHRVGRVEDVVKEGQDVTCKVLSVDAENQRIGLSIKALAPAPEAPAPAAEEATPATVRPTSNTPLKGGLDRPAGGEKFGLKW